MKLSGGLTAIAAILAILAALACGAAATPTSPPVLTPTPIPPPTVASNSAPVPRSAVGNTFNEPLSSGLSVADVVEKVLPSVVQIIAGSGSGTGFIVNESGLVVTNKHVVQGSSQVTLRLATGGQFRGKVIRQHPSLDLAYIEIDATRSFAPIAVGNSDEVRVGEAVIAIGFPLGRTLGLEPTVSVGIVSAKRNDRLQTDAALNPGNSGGPLLNVFGQSIGVVTSRVDSTDSGRAVAGIAFAIPINEVKSGMARQVSPSGRVLPTPTSTPLPPIGPTPDIAATRAAIETADAYRRQAEQATRTAIEAQHEAERYAASLEATRIAELPTPTPTVPPTPTPTPTPEPTPTPLPTPTPHPAIYCEEWEGMVLDWIKKGNNYRNFYYYGEGWEIVPTVPNHPELSAHLAHDFCITDFPMGILGSSWSSVEVGNSRGQILPGTYEYRWVMGNAVDKRVKDWHCRLNIYNPRESGRPWREIIDLTQGEPFTFQLFQYHGSVRLICSDHLGNSNGALFRIGD